MLNGCAVQVGEMCRVSTRGSSTVAAKEIWKMPETLVVEQGGIGTGSRRSSQRKGVDSLTQCYGQVKLSQVEAVVVVIVSENKE